MPRSADTFNIPQRLLLLAVIPLLGIISLGGISIWSLYATYRGYQSDIGAVRTFRGEISDLKQFCGVLGEERDAALRFQAHPGDSGLREKYLGYFAATDEAVAGFTAKLERLAAEHPGSLFSDRLPVIRNFFSGEVPAGRAAAQDGRHSAGDVFQIYMKLAYNALLRTECFRLTLATQPALNHFDGVLALQKIQLQESMATSLMALGREQGGLRADGLTLIRRQYFASTENEYYLLKFEPELRAYFRATLRTSDDDAAFNAYVAAVASSQPENKPLPPFQPKSGSVSDYLAGHFRSYDQVYEFADTHADRLLHALALGRQQQAEGIGGILFLGIAITIGASTAMTRKIRHHLVAVAKSIDAASDDVAAASGQLGSAGLQISRDATEYASAIDLIGSNLNEVSAVAKTNKEQAAHAATMTTRTRDSVDAGLGTIQQVETAMSSARSSAQKINKIVSRINDISFQTNLLALNAAVEAARAGEAGAGFAVVADEVRQLAKRCAEASTETAELVTAASQDTATALEKSEELTGRFREVSARIHEVSEIVSVLSANFIQQAANIGEISQSVAKQGGIAQSIASAAEETASTTDSMAAQVGSLKVSVERLAALLGQAAPGPAAAPPARPEPSRSRPFPPGPTDWRSGRMQRAGGRSELSPTTRA
jgi:hypothetical protein